MRTLSNRERTLALSALVVIAIWMLMSWIGLPQLTQLRQLQQRAFVSQQRLERLRELASRKASIEQAYQAYAGYWSDEAEERLQSLFLNELEQLGGGGNLQLSLRPRPVRREGHVSRFGVEVDIEATQEALVAFLDQLLTWPRLIEIDRLLISASASKEYPLKATLLINQVVVKP